MHVENHVKSHNKPVQVIEHNIKSSLIKTDTIDIADLAEVRRESYDSINYKSVEFRMIF